MSRWRIPSGLSLFAPLSLLLLLHINTAQATCSGSTNGTASSASTLTGTDFVNGRAAGSITPDCVRDFIASADVNAVPALVSAAGATQSAATALAANLNIVTSATAGSAIGVIATAAYTKIWNDTTTTINVYPISGAQFEGYGVNIPVAVGPGSTIETSMSSSTQGYVRVVPAPGMATPTFVVANGQILDPTGAVFRGWGVGVYACQLGAGDKDATTGGSALSTQIRAMLPGINIVRLAYYQSCWSGASPSASAAFINDMTAHHVLVVIEDHDTAHRVLTASTSPTLATEHAWYVGMASYYKGNPYIAFETMNEPGYALTANAFSGTGSIAGNVLTVTGTPTNTLLVGSFIQGSGIIAPTQVVAFGTGSGGAGTYYVTNTQTVGSESITGTYGELSQFTDTYSAIRNDAGSNVPIWIYAGEGGGDSLGTLNDCSTNWCNQGSPSTTVLNTIAKFRNVLWDSHNYDVSGSTVSAIETTMGGSYGMNEWGLAKSADGAIPNLSLEGGNSSNGSSLDANATAGMQAYFTNADSRYFGFAAWNWQADTAGDDYDNMTSAYTLPANPTFTAYGNNVACYISRAVPLGQTAASSCPSP